MILERIASELREFAANVRLGLGHQRRHPLPALLLMIGLAPPVAVTVGVPLYADTVASELFVERLDLDDESADGSPADDRLTFLWSFNRLSGGSLSWSDIVELDDTLFTTDHAPIPVDAAERFIETTPFDLVVDEATGGTDIGTVTIASISDDADHVELLSGRLPSPADAEAPVEVLVESVFATDEGLGTGQSLVLLADGQRLDAVVSGVWTDGESQSVFGTAAAFRKRLLVPAGTIIDVVSPRFDDVVQNARWYLALDSDELGSDTVDPVLDASERLDAAASAALAGVRQLTNPDGPLKAFRDDQRALERGLAGFSLPLLALALGVALMLSTITLRTRHGEFRVLRHRGIRRRSLFAGVAAESVTITVGALVLGLGGAWFISSMMSRTVTFFRFESSPAASAIRSDEVVAALRFAPVLLAILLIPALITIWRAHADASSGGDDRPPWWQRTYLDVVAIVVIAVIAWRGVRDTDGRAELLDDPAVILLPSATALACGLVVVRSMPLIMRGVAAVLGRTDRTAAVVAARRAARVPGDTATPLLLLVITASLATFTASLAVTLDLQLLDRSHHAVGAQSRVIDRGVELPAAFEPPADDRTIPRDPATITRHGDADAYVDLWGIDDASPMIELVGTGSHEGADVPGLLFVGVDPASFTRTAFWRSDYASAPLADLMRRLERDPTAVLISTRLPGASSLSDGSPLRLSLIAASGPVDFTATVVGDVEQFPRWFPDRESPLVVGRLDLVEALAGATHDRTVLLTPGDRIGDRARIDADAAGVGADLGGISDVDRLIDSAQRAPGRQGVLGLLTIGVALATALTLAGFVVSTIMSFRRRTTELGVLRAMGMSRGEVTTLALFDLATVMMMGLAIAIALGLGLSRWFIPLLVDTPPGDAPELLPAIAWSATAVITLALVALLLASGAIIAGTLRRLKAYEVIRLGES